MVNAVVLAGGKQKFGHYKSKAAVELNGRRCVDYVVEALDKAKYIDDIIIVGNVDNLGEKIYDYSVTHETRVFVHNAAVGYEHFRLKMGDKEPLFYIFSDIPFVTSQSIDDFLERADYNTDLNLCFVDINKINEKFSNYKEYYPYTRLNDFSFRMGNCGLVKVENVIKSGSQKVFQKAFEARRFNEFLSLLKFLFLGYSIYSHLRDVRKFQKTNLFGVPMILPREFYFDLNIKDIEEKISRVFSKEGNLSVNIVKSYYPELAVDIDTLKDKQYVENHPKFRNVIT